MEEFLEFLNHYKFIIGLFAVIGIEVAPIKIHPLAWFGKLLNSSLQKDIDHLKKEINDLRYQQDMSDLGAVRNRILSLYRIKREGMELTDDDLSSIRHDYDRYMYLKEKYHYITNDGKKTKINGEIDQAIKNLLGE